MVGHLALAVWVVGAAMIKLIQGGQEPGIREAVTWLEGHGHDKSTIKGVTVDGQVGEPLVITAMFIVRDPAELEVDE